MGKTLYVIGLGNPEARYDHTPHNIGRDFVNLLAQEGAVSWRNKGNYEAAAVSPQLILVRPNTYMNLSGQAVSELLHFYKANVSDILVCVDDFDIPLGQVRLRGKGSAGTHNGLKSIIAYLNTQDFARLRLGVGPIPQHSNAAQYVLAPFNASMRAQVQTLLDTCKQVLTFYMQEGLASAMNRFNSNKN